MSALTGNNIQNTYQGLVKLANSTTGVTSVTQSLQDGLGNNLPIQVSENVVNISGSFLVNGLPITFTNTGSFATTGSNVFVGNQTVTGSINITGQYLVNGSPVGGSSGTSGTSGSSGSSGTSGTSGTSGQNGINLSSKAGSVLASDPAWVSNSYNIIFSTPFNNSNYSPIVDVVGNFQDVQISGKTASGFTVTTIMTPQDFEWVAISYGESGSGGTSGTSGTSGVNGSSGTSGINGSSGTSGSNGSSGSSGTSGSNGSSGSSGTSGSNGSSGTSGTAGTSGTSGSSPLYSGTSTSSFTLQVGCCYAFTTQTGLAFAVGQPIRIFAGVGAYANANVSSYNSGTGALLVDVVSFVGSGTYTSWTISLAGASGTNGTSGTSGNSGSSGTSGSNGSSGTSGTSGSNGSSGTSGTSGATGSSGTSGTSGTSGVNGTSGTSGINGSSGTSGTSGNSGSSGTSGTSGNTGSSGTSGTAGTSGTSGVSNIMIDTVHNGSVTTLTKGTPVYASGSTGANPNVYPADAADPNKMPVAYIIQNSITAGSTGQGIILGDVDGIDLDGYPIGSSVYVAAGGGLTNIRPTGSAQVQFIGIVTKNGTGGKLLTLNPGPATLPNIATGKIWMGNGSSYPSEKTPLEAGLIITGSISTTQAITGSLIQSGSNSLMIAPNDNGAGTWIKNRVVISDVPGGDTPRLWISGSDGAYSEFGRGFIAQDTTKQPSLDANIYTVSNVTKNSQNIVAVYNDDFSVDVELQMFANSGSIGFADWDNGNGGYIPFMTLAPNVGDNPRPQFKRGISVTGSVNITGQYLVNGTPISSGDRNGLITTGSIGSNQFISGSINGNVVAVTPDGGRTGSFNLNNGNFFTIPLVAASQDFRFEFSNIKPGQTVNIRVNPSGGNTVVFPSYVKQISGSAYVPTNVSGSTDILTLVSFDATTLNLVNVKNLL